MRKEEKAPERGSEGLRAERWGGVMQGLGGGASRSTVFHPLWGGRDGVNPSLMM